MDVDGDYSTSWGLWFPDTFEGGAAQIVNDAGDLVGTTKELRHNLQMYTVGTYAGLPRVAVGGDDVTIVTQPLTVWRPPGTPWPYFTEGLFAHRYDAAGTAIDRVTVRTPVTLYEHNYAGAVASDAAGNFVVTWLNLTRIQEAGYDEETNTAIPELWWEGLKAKTFNAAGAATSGEIDIRWDVFENPYPGGHYATNPTTTWSDYEVAMGKSPGSGFTVVWSTAPVTPGLPDFDIYARSYTAAGTPLGGTVTVNATTAGNQMYPEVAATDAGDFVVAWHGYAGGTGGPQTIYARQLTAAGAGGPELVVETGTGANGYDIVSSPASVGVNAATGEFVVGYVVPAPADTPAYGAVRLRHFTAAGAAAGSLTLVHWNELDKGPGGRPSVALGSNGVGVVAWRGVRYFPEYGWLSDSTFAQRFQLTAGDGDTISWTPVGGGSGDPGDGPGGGGSPGEPAPRSAGEQDDGSRPAVPSGGVAPWVARRSRPVPAGDPFLLGVELD